MNERDIRTLIRIVEETGIDELEIRSWWGRRIRVTKRLSGVAPALPIATSGHSGDVSPASPVSTEAVPEEAGETGMSYSEETHYIIRSPIVGTFYRAPAPDAPPYVEVGDSIKAGQVVCIVEAMKLMNEIQAERGGTVVEILVENATPVEYNQVMIVIEPEG